LNRFDCFSAARVPFGQVRRLLRSASLVLISDEASIAPFFGAVKRLIG